MTNMADTHPLDVATPCLLAGGVVLLVVSFVSPFLMGGHRRWSEQDALEFQLASAEYHDAMHASAHGMRSASKKVASQRAELDTHRIDEARGHYERLEARLRSAQDGGRMISAWARWIGCALLLGGVASGWIRRQLA
jgi:hypothetical protein